MATQNEHLALEATRGDHGSRRSSSRPLNRGNLGKGSGDGASATVKISLLSALLVALIGGTATILAALINKEPDRTPANPTPTAAAPQPETSEMPLPDCPTCISGGKTFIQQASAASPKSTFRDPRAFKGRGPSVQPGQQVEVVCRFLDPNAPLSVQPGWWYLIASPPWNRQYYTVANSYLNGDPPEGPALTSGDNGVPVC